MNVKNKFAVALSAIVMSIMVIAPALAVDSTVIVTGDTAAGNNQSGWLFNRDVTTMTPYEFNSDEASIGTGSLYVMPISNTLDGNSDKFIAENFVRADMGDINSISYDFMIGAGGGVTEEEQFYMNVYVNFGVSAQDKFYDCRYNVVPTVGSITNFTTVTFDPTQEYDVATRAGGQPSPFPCPASPADMGSDAFVRVFSLNVGDTSASDFGLDGYLDNVVVDTASGVTTYDFEPALTPADKADCKKGGWMSFNNPTFKNQGDCVSFVASDGNAKGNPILSFLSSIF